MAKHLRMLLKSIWTYIKKKWWFVPLWFIWQTFEDRIFGWVNIKIDSYQGIAVESTKYIIEWSKESDLGIAGIILFLFIVGLIIHVFCDIHLLHEKQKKTSLPLEPIILIEHNDIEEGYYQDSFVLPPQVKGVFNTNPNISQNWRLCRISIYNPSQEIIKNIKVKLTKIEPEISNIKVPLFLNYQHDTTPPLKESIDLNPEERRFVNVVQWQYEESELYYIVTIEDIIKTFEVNFYNRSNYKIKIEVTGDRMQKIEKDFYFGMRNKDNTYEKIWLWPVNEINTVNQKKLSPVLIIDYKENDPQYLHEPPHGRQHRISIENTTNQTIEDVTTELSGMKPLHAVFKRLIPLSLEKSISINPGKTFFTLIQWVWSMGGVEYFGIVLNGGKDQITFSAERAGKNWTET